MILYYNNYKNENIKIDQLKTEEEVYKKINEFLKNHNYTSYYTRSWIDEEDSKKKWIDFGSHVEFFIIYNEKGWDFNGDN